METGEPTSMDDWSNTDMSRSKAWSQVSKAWSEVSPSLWMTGPTPIYLPVILYECLIYNELK